MEHPNSRSLAKAAQDDSVRLILARCLAAFGLKMPVDIGVFIQI
jgi:hypothetical protein